MLVIHNVSIYNTQQFYATKTLILKNEIKIIILSQHTTIVLCRVFEKMRSHKIKDIKFLCSDCRYYLTSLTNFFLFNFNYLLFENDCANKYFTKSKVILLIVLFN